MDTLERDAVACETPTVEEQNATSSVAEILDGSLLREVEDLRQIYPEFDLEAKLSLR